jgi:hypothetical protein
MEPYLNWNISGENVHSVSLPGQIIKLKVNIFILISFMLDEPYGCELGNMIPHISIMYCSWNIKHQRKQFLKTYILVYMLESLIENIFAASWQNQHNGFANSMDPDQPTHPRSLIRIHAVRLPTLLQVENMIAGRKPIMLVLRWCGSYVI